MAYMKSDGNGGIIINKGLLTLLTFLFFVFTTFATIVVYSATVKADVDHHSIILEEVQEELHESDTRIDNIETLLSSVGTDINNIKDDVIEIRHDVKSLLKYQGEDQK